MSGRLGKELNSRVCTIITSTACASSVVLSSWGDKIFNQ